MLKQSNHYLPTRLLYLELCASQLILCFQLIFVRNEPISAKWNKTDKTPGLILVSVASRDQQYLYSPYLLVNCRITPSIKFRHQVLAPQARALREAIKCKSSKEICYLLGLFKDLTGQFSSGCQNKADWELLSARLLPSLVQVEKMF